VAATIEQVRAINGSAAADEVLQPFLDVAVLVLASARIANCLTAKGATDAIKDASTAWLACHLFAMTSIGQDTNALKRETFEGYTEEKAMSQVMGGGVMSTNYGQTANTLTGGCLVETDKRLSSVCFFG
jgi:hypothetical protein